MAPPAPSSPPRHWRVPLAVRIAWWTAWIGAAGGGLALAGVAWLLPVWARRGVERAAERVEETAGPLEPTWRRPDLTPEDNATPRLIAAAEAVRLDAAERELILASARGGDLRMTEERREELAPLVERNREAIETLLSTSGLANDFGLDLLDPETSLPDALGAEQFSVTQLAVMDAHLSLLDGDSGRSERIAAVLGAQSIRYGEVPTELLQLLARVYQSYQLHLIHDLARACDEPSCPERLRDSLPPNRSSEAFGRAVAGETEYVLRALAKARAESPRYIDPYNRLVLAWFYESWTDTLDHWLVLLAGWDLDPREMEAALTFEPGPLEPLNPFRRSRIIPYWPFLGRLRTTAEARDLAELALTVHAEALRGIPCDRALPAALAARTFAELDPLELAVEHHDDGSCTLRRADADFIVSEIFGGNSFPPPFEWPVTAPTPSSSPPPIR